MRAGLHSPRAMQITPRLDSLLGLAGNMISRRILTLAQGRAVAADLGTLDTRQGLGLTSGDPHDPLLLPRYRQMMAAPPWPDDAFALVLLHASRLPMEGTPLTQALVAEFADLAGQVNGLVIAVPYQPVEGPRKLVMHSIRIVACPPALRALADELLMAVSRGLMAFAQGQDAWMDALQIEPGVEPRPPAHARDPEFWAAAITPEDPHPHSNGKVTAHLEAFLAEGQFEGGLLFEQALRAVRFDFSMRSLEAVDALLDRLRAEHAPQRDAVLATPAGRNLVHLLAAYLGETLVLHTQALVTWYTPAQLQRVAPGWVTNQGGALDSLLCMLNGNGRGTGYLMQPCDIVAGRLFGATGPALAEAAHAAVRAVHAARVGAMVDPGERWKSEAAHGPLGVVAPDWFAHDPILRRWFETLPTLWREGQVVWSHLVQANSLLFRPGNDNCPGELLYDPTGRVDPQRFAAAAMAMFRLKGLRLRNPWLAFFAQALTHERTRTSGVELPASLGARGLQTATLLFFRGHLPGGVISGHRMPILVSDKLPGMVMVLPSRYWPANL
jgi:hypothetical protein